MGSRKKTKPTTSGKISPMSCYKQLSLNDRIAFKAFIYWFGRQRMSLATFLKNRYNSKSFCKLVIENSVHDGHRLLQGLIQ